MSLHLVDRHKMMRASPLNEQSMIVDHEIIKSTPLRNRVLIYGAGNSNREALDLLESDDWTVYALNAVAPIDRDGALRADLWWDLHQRCSQSEADLRWIHDCPVPIYVPDDLLNAGPTTVRYPIERIEEKFSSYFSCTFAYMIALALDEGMTEIALYGVDLHMGDARERTVEFACVSWWLGYAEAKGVTIRLPSDSMLGRHPFRYGLEYTEEKEAVERYLMTLAAFNCVRSYDKIVAQLAKKTGKADGDVDAAISGPVGMGG